MVRHSGSLANEIQGRPKGGGILSTFPLLSVELGHVLKGVLIVIRVLSTVPAHVRGVGGGEANHVDVNGRDWP